MSATSSFSAWPAPARSASVKSSEHITLTDNGRVKLASVDLRPTVTAADAAALKRLLAPAGVDGASTLLQSVIGDPVQSNPDFVAVRTGAGITAELWGGGNVSSITDGSTGTVMTLFGTGSPPNAVKGVAITFGAGATTADRDLQTRMGMSWLAGHLDDRPTASGIWPGSLFDCTA